MAFGGRPGAIMVTTQERTIGNACGVLLVWARSTRIERRLDDATIGSVRRRHHPDAWNHVQNVAEDSETPFNKASADPYSDRSAIAGSTCVALRAGRYAAANATMPRRRH